MKKLSSAISFIAASAAYLSLTASAYAQSICPTGDFAPLCKLKLSSASSLVGRIVTILLILGIIIAIIFLIWGGVRWIMSGGDKGKIDGARSTITAAIVGLILAFLAFFFVNFLTLVFTGKTITTFTIPTLF